MTYKLEILPSAEKEIKKLPKEVGIDIMRKIKSLVENPRPHGYEKLTSFELPNLKEKNIFRVRVGNYRIIYGIKEEKITVTVAKIAHRKEVYK